MRSQWFDGLRAAAVVTVLTVGAGQGALADVVTDGSVGAPGIIGTTQTLTAPAITIPQTFGSVAGSNLFHSFESFNINSGQSVTFTATDPFSNVISRVTGGTASQINGALVSEIAGANFWFLNPSGVFFGATSSLDVPGSFHVSTGDSIIFGGDPYRFDARLKNPPPLLLVAAPVGFGFSDAPAGSITVNGAQLDVSRGNSLSLIGGDLSITGGTLRLVDDRVQSITTSNVRISLMALAGVGIVTLTNSDGSPGTGTTDVTQFGDIILSGGTVIRDDVSTGTRPSVQVEPQIYITGGQIELSNAQVGLAARTTSGDSIRVTGESLLMEQGSRIETLNFGDSSGGNAVRIAVRDDAILKSGSQISLSNVANGGKTGDLLISSSNGRLVVEGNGLDFDGGGTGIRTFANGADESSIGGSIEINVAKAVDISDRGSIGFERNVAGRKASGMQISAENIQLTDGEISAIYRGSSTDPGPGITINARKSVVLEDNSTIAVELRDGTFNDTLYAGLVSGPISITVADGDPNGPDISVKSGSSIVQRFVNSPSDAKSGDITLSAPGDILIDGGFVGTTVNDLLTQPVDPLGFCAVGGSALGVCVGKAGGISITADSLKLTNGSSVAADTNSLASGGQVNVTVRDLVLENSSSLSASTSSDIGSGGSIDIDASTVSVSNSTISTATTGLLLPGLNESFGVAGKLTIANAKSIAVSNGGLISSSSTSSGRAGSAGRMFVTTDSMTLSGGGRIAVDTVDGDPSFIDLSVDELNVLGAGSAVSAAVTGTGGLGNMNDTGFIDIGPNLASNAETFVVNVVGGSITTAASSSGRAGDITVKADGGRESSVFVSAGGSIDSSSSGAGVDAGSSGTIEINADRITVSDRGQIAATTKDGDSDPAGPGGEGGSVTLNVGELETTGGAQVTVATTGRGNAGDITVQGRGSTDLNPTAATLVELSGSRTIPDPNNPGATLVVPSGLVSSSSSRLNDAGKAGSITVTADTVDLSNRAQIAATTVAGGTVADRGDITLNVNTLLATTDAVVNAATTGGGQAGNITVNGVAGPGSQALNVALGARSGLATSTTGAGSAGNITLQATSVTVSDSSGQAELSGIVSSSTGSGKAGNIIVRSNSLTGIDGGQIAATTVGGEADTNGDGVAEGGSITLQVDGLSLSPDAQVTASTTGAGVGGSIRIEDRDTSTALNLVIDTPSINTSTSGSGAAGTIELVADSVTVSGDGRLASSSIGTNAEAGGQAGKAGNVSVTANTLTLSNGGQIAATTIDGDGLDSDDIGTDRDGGSITLAVGTLTVQSGAKVTAATTGAGNAGDITVWGIGSPPASRAERVAITGGELTSSTTAGGKAGSVKVFAQNVSIAAADGIRGGLFSESGFRPTAAASSRSLALAAGDDGDAGSITVDAGQLTITNNGQISVAAFGTGDAGSVTIQGLGQPADGSPSLLLGSGGQIDAQALQGQGGDVLILTAAEGVGSVLLDQGQILAISNDPNGQGSILIAGPGSTSNDNSTTGPRRVILQNGSTVSANSGNPNAGNATVNARVIVIDGTSAVRASGDVFTIGSVLGSPLELPEAETVDASDDLATRCTPAEIGGRSTFVVRGNRPVELRPAYLPVEGTASGVLSNQSVACAARLSAP